MIYLFSFCSKVTTESPDEQQKFQPLDDLGSADHSNKTDSNCVASQDIDTLVRKAQSGRPTRKISMNLADNFDRSLLESVRELKLDVPPGDLAATTTSPTSTSEAVGLLSFPTAPPVFDTAPPILSSRRDRVRKTSAPPSLNPMLPETQKAHNYFFTGSLFSAMSSMSTPGSQNGSPTVSHVDLSRVGSMDVIDASSKASSVRASPIRETQSFKDVSAKGVLTKVALQMEEKAHHEAFDAKARVAKRRPRASALREMNFLAPQST